MLFKTKAIVVRYTKYNEKNVILQAFTKEFGMVSYMVYNPWAKNASLKAAYLQAFTILEIDVEHKATREIQQIKESKLIFHGSSIHSNPYKQSIVFFLTEIISKTITETHQDVVLFDFIENSAINLDKLTQFGTFHHHFLIQLSRYLGFFPNNEANENNKNKIQYFDLVDGIFTQSKPFHNNYIEGEIGLLFYHLSTDPIYKPHLLNRETKQILLQNIITYYLLHLPDIGHIKSLEILQTMFND